MEKKSTSRQGFVKRSLCGSCKVISINSKTCHGWDNFIPPSDQLTKRGKLSWRQWVPGTIWSNGKELGLLQL